MNGSSSAAAKTPTTFALERRISSFYVGAAVAVGENDAGSRSSGKLLFASACGSRLFSVIWDAVFVADLTTGLVASHVIGDGDEILTASLSGNVLLCVCRSTMAHFFDVEAARSVATFRSHEATAVTCHFDAKSGACVIAFADRSLRVYEAANGACIASLKGLASNALATSVRIGDGLVLCGAADGEFAVYAAAAASSTQKSLAFPQKAPIWTGKPHASCITAVDISARLNSAILNLVTFSRDKTVSLFAVDPREKSVKLVKSLLVNCAIESGFCVAAAAESDEVVVGIAGNAVSTQTASAALWNVSRGLRLGSVAFSDAKNPAAANCLVPLGASFSRFVVGASDHMLRVFNADSAFKTLTLAGEICGHQDEITDICCLAADATNSSHEDRNLFVASNSNFIKAYNASRLFESDAIGHAEGHADVVLALACRRFKDGALLLSAAKDASVCVWRRESGASSFSLAARCDGHTQSVGCVAFNHDANSVAFATASADHTIKVWQASDASGGFVAPAAIFTVKAHDKDVNCVAFSPNDRLLASSSQDKTIKLWRSADGGAIATLKGHSRGVSSVAFSPCEALIASSSADKTIRVWSATDFSCVRTFEGHAASVLKVVFSGDGQQLLSVSSDGLVKVWSVRRGECTSTLDAHRDKIWALAFDGRRERLFTGGADATIAVWKDVTEQQLAEAAAAHKAQIETSQKLSNFLLKKDYRNALVLAFTLNQPKKFFDVLVEFSRTLSAQENLFMQCDFVAANVPKLLDWCKEWNANFKKSCVAQRMIRGIFAAYGVERLAEMLSAADSHVSLQALLEALLPHTQKHIEKWDDAYKNTFFIEHLLK